ncbi:Aste57867_23993 [Aphanomyces stellatus]|uniref:Aste57867_23993 protein n=1 Tax=Aphanomyces stellatus TaxID=120398 RepID=A0A485LPZ0_9STRA|nr:hypothetical protein As57867_023920 [Aphanomyces stellatus]VFU00636.1 Aste57867_23993 [Aphanomyces stellatus]
MTTNMMVCLFNGCNHAALPTGKCEAHKARTKCSVADCFNQTYARQVCIKHGGKAKCIVDGCDANVRSQGFCCKHGPKTTKKTCQVDGCNKVAHARHRCVRHGGGQKCKVDACPAFARSGGFCQRHGDVSSSTSGQDDTENLMELIGDIKLDEWWTADDFRGCDVDFTVEETALLDFFITA